jgi:hypothetical protein
MESLALREAETQADDGLVDGVAGAGREEIAAMSHSN